MTTSRISRSAFGIFLAFALLTPATSQAAIQVLDIQPTIVKKTYRIEDVKYQTDVIRSLPSLAITGAAGGSSVHLRYNNIPEDSRIVIMNLKKGRAGAWELLLPRGGKGTATVALPADLSRGTYVLRVTSMEDTKRITESASFVRTTDGIDTAFSMHQVAAAYAFILGQDPVMKPNLTKKRAEAFCKKEMRTHSDSQVICGWNEAEL